MALESTTASNMTLFGTALQAGSQLSAGHFAASQGALSNTFAQANATLLERQADSVRDAARFEAWRIGRRGRAAVGKKRANIGAGGITASGSAGLDLADTAYQYKIDESLILMGGMMQGQGLKTQAAFQSIRGRMAKSAGKAAQRSSQYAAAGSILGGAATSISQMNTV